MAMSWTPGALSGNGVADDAGITFVQTSVIARGIAVVVDRGPSGPHQQGASLKARGPQLRRVGASALGREQRIPHIRRRLHRRQMRARGERLQPREHARGPGFEIGENGAQVRDALRNGAAAQTHAALQPALVGAARAASGTPAAWSPDARCGGARHNRASAPPRTSARDGGCRSPRRGRMRASRCAIRAADTSRTGRQTPKQPPAPTTAGSGWRRRWLRAAQSGRDVWVSSSSAEFTADQNPTGLTRRKYRRPGAPASRRPGARQGFRD